MTKPETPDAASIGKRVIETEQQGLKALARGIDDIFAQVVTLIGKLKGRTILAGVGKSGHVARKIAATLASTGTPALFVHPTEASHGDMGMITGDDAVIALSRSGETGELADIITFCRRFGIPLVAVTAVQTSTLAKAAKYVLLLPDTPEACAVTGAPTTSATLQMALGDALAVSLLELRGFTTNEFKAFHPGGTLGANLLTAEDIMHTGDRLPLIADSEKMDKALDVLGGKGFGCVGILDQKERLRGIITDGDIRRNLSSDLPDTPVTSIMTCSPKSITPDTLAAEVLHIMTAKPPQVMQVFILQESKPIGILHMHDLLRAGLA